jgi:hypothetical protein
MKSIALVAAFLAASTGLSFAQYGGYGTGSNSQSHYTQGHSNSNGSYTQPHYQTNPNSTTSDNYGTRGNVNPYTGRSGTRNGY